MKHHLQNGNKKKVAGKTYYLVLILRSLPLAAENSCLFILPQLDSKINYFDRNPASLGTQPQVRHLEVHVVFICWS